MEVLLSFTGSDAMSNLESLNRWLRGDPAFDGRIRMITAISQPGHLSGTVPDALAIAVGSSGALTVLASAVKSWITRPRGANLRIRLRENGREMDIELSNLEKADAAGLAKLLIERGRDE